LTTVVWTLSALTDVADIRRYIATFNPHAAQRLAARLIATGNSLVTFPDRGRPVPDTDLREATVVYPYIIRYRVDGDRVLILRVRHGMRRP
jgi:plasmid stabilization system protein ParE